jgi:tRNA (adenine57-N1/adenine58-N1)-methyltransferase
MRDPILVTLDTRRDDNLDDNGAPLMVNTAFGNYASRTLRDAPLGVQLPATTSLGYAYVLPLTPDLYERSLNHRTQIVHHRDAATIIGGLDIQAGSTIVESGTGSGALTVAFAVATGVSGAVHTFEFHAERASKAREDFAKLGLSDVIRVTHTDACVPNAFGTDLAHQADAVFLDLPKPQAALENALAVLRPGTGRLCCYSPCIEQVQRTCVALHASGAFYDISTIECVEQPTFCYDAKVEEPFDPKVPRPPGPPQTVVQSRQVKATRQHTAFLTFATRRPVAATRPVAPTSA